MELKRLQSFDYFGIIVNGRIRVVGNHSHQKYPTYIRFENKNDEEKIKNLEEGQKIVAGSTFIYHEYTIEEHRLVCHSFSLKH